MQIIESTGQLLTYVDHCKQKGLKIGLVPTMGALHAGHLSLVKKSLSDNDITVVSIFVNPTQFNNPQDLATYPRQPEADFKLLATEGVDVVFAPTEEEIYPDDSFKSKQYSLGHVAEVMEGKFRPGHFNGVAQVVNRLFVLCRPNRAYFGEKDFQQIAVISRMVKSEGLDVEIIRCPIIREASGLALSSRNQLLTEKEREDAAMISNVLKQSKDAYRNYSPQDVIRSVTAKLDAIPGFHVEYFDIVDGETLKSISSWNDAPLIVGCIAVYVGKVRLIDNIIYKTISCNDN